MHDAMSRNRIFGDAGFDRDTTDGKGILSLKIADILRKRRCEADRINDCRGAQFLDSAHAINAGQQHKRKKEQALAGPSNDPLILSCAATWIRVLS